MSLQKMMVNEVDPNGKWLYRVGSISAFVFGIGYLIIIALYIPAGGPPSGSGVEARLIYLAENSTAWWGILGLSVLTDLLYIPMALALYLALKGINRNAMLTATAFVMLFVVLDLAITWTNYAALITLSGSYAAAANDAQKAAFVAAANYPFALLDSPHLMGVYTILVPVIGILMTGLVMLKGIFSKITAYLAVVSGILSIVSVVGTFCQCFVGNHNHRFCSHSSLGLLCGPQTLQGSVIRVKPSPADGSMSSNKLKCINIVQ